MPKAQEGVNADPFAAYDDSEFADRSGFGLRLCWRNDVCSAGVSEASDGLTRVLRKASRVVV